MPLLKTLRLISFLPAMILLSCSGNLTQSELFTDDFMNLPVGYLSNDAGALTEYHYLPESGKIGNWTISAFGWQKGYHKAWEIVEDSTGRFLRQNYYAVDESGAPLHPHTHPLIVGGDSSWHNYNATFSFTPGRTTDKCGLVFRYQNSRCYYFFGMEGNRLMLKSVEHATAPHRPFERVLASRPFNWETDVRYTGVVTVREDRIYVLLNDSISLTARDRTFSKGKIGLLSDVPADFYKVNVSALNSDKRKLSREKRRLNSQISMRISENPAAVLWKSLSTEGFGTGRNLRFGDLNGDGMKDILIGQVVQHGPGDAYPELSCLTAITLDGELLWQIGKPDPDNYLLTNDVAFQIHDLDGDGKKEVIYTMGFKIFVVRGSTGELIKSVPTPLARPPGDRFNRILGDCIMFCDLSGKGRDSDLIIKDRYWNVWAYNEHLEFLWSKSCNTGHYPYAADIDGDGRDELAVGYSLLDHKGALLWTLDSLLGDHAGGVAVSSLFLPGDSSMKVIYGASDWGAVFADTDGKIMNLHPVGHVQTPSVANFRSDLPGLETISANFWGSQGIIHFFDAHGNLYYSFEPGPFGSMCLPVNWKGDGEEYFLLNTNPGDGGLFNGLGQLMQAFPDDGHPHLCNAVLDLTGDARDEIVTWDQNGIWVYTQSDNPRAGRMYQPERNPLYNNSNYQVSVSIPDWNE